MAVAAQRRPPEPLGPAGPEAWHAMPASEVLAALGSSPTGLTEAEARTRLLGLGPNRLEALRRPWIGWRLLAQFTHFMAVLLWVGGAVAFAARLPELAWAIWAVNLLNGAFSFWQEYRAERATEALQRLMPEQARVLREGRERRIPAADLVPGDVLALAEGDRVSADARLLEAAELRVDQSVLTGESDSVRKSAAPSPGRSLARLDRPNLVFAGSTVVAGRGRAAVVSTGMATAFGAVARLTGSVQAAPSPLMLEMARVSRTVTAVAVGVGAVFFAVAVLLAGMDLAGGFLFSLGMIVAFVPEGLLPTVTLSLALGVQRMARRNALVKRLSAVETLGCTQVICTDKTGTLTQNEMTVREAWCGGRTVAVGGVGYAPEPPLEDRPSEMEPLLRACLLCNDARLVPPSDEDPRWTAVGDPTEAALLVLARKGGLEPGGPPRVAEIPFDSRRKRMSTVYRAEGGLLVYVKGAPGEVVGRCGRVLLGGAEVPLDPSAALAEQDRMARSGLRVLAVAVRRVERLPEPLEADALERDLTLLGLVGMLDPPRAEVEEAVAKCRRAGIRVVMITGDYGLTAESVARRIGILGPAPARLVTGAELEAMDGPDLEEALRGEVLFARVAPEHKLRVVEALQRGGAVVAVTGDGVNDAPALRRADIGVAMGRSGSDVAREAADMVLADDSFASIVHAVEEGRAVYDNLGRFVTYIFTSNTPEAVPFILHALSGGRLPLALGVMQILAIDLGTDMVPALALGAEPPAPGVMDRPPRDRRRPLITRDLLARAYLVLGPVQALAAMAAFLFAYRLGGLDGWLGLPASGPLYREATTMALAAVVATQIGNLFVHRAGGRNPWIALGLATEVTFLALLSYVPALNRVFGTAPLPFEGWLFAAALIPALPLTDMLWRWRR